MNKRTPFLAAPAIIAVMAVLAAVGLVNQPAVQTGLAAEPGPPAAWAAVVPGALAAVRVLAGPASPAARQAAQQIRLVPAPEGNEARYLVREQLASLEFPNDAVGVTSGISGALVLEPDGSIVRAESRFEVDLASLKSDSDRRDNYIRRNTLLTDSLPKAVFVPVVARGLPSPLLAAGEFTFQVTGELTIRGVTRPVTWQVTASPGAGGIFSGTARTEFNFALFAIPIPRVASVLSVTDNIRLEYDFRLIPAPPPSAAGE